MCGDKDCGTFRVYTTSDHSASVSVLLLDRERNELHFPYQSEADPEVGARLAGQRFPANLGIAGSVLKSGRAEQVDEPSSDPRFYSEVDRRTGVTTKSILAAPLIARGETVGVIEAVNHRVRSTRSVSSPSAALFG